MILLPVFQFSGGIENSSQTLRLSLHIKSTERAAVPKCILITMIHLYFGVVRKSSLKHLNFSLITFFMKETEDFLISLKNG